MPGAVSVKQPGVGVRGHMVHMDHGNAARIGRLNQAIRVMCRRAQPFQGQAALALILLLEVHQHVGGAPRGQRVQAGCPGQLQEGWR